MTKRQLMVEEMGAEKYKVTLLNIVDQQIMGGYSLQAGAVLTKAAQELGIGQDSSETTLRMDSCACPCHRQP
jgi:hypothetical protein